MGEAKHTPGPWAISKEHPCIIKQRYEHLAPDDNSGVLIGSASGYSGSGFFPNDEEAVFNARLMAAAPDLLAACKAVIDHVEDPDVLRSGSQCTLCYSHRKLLREAIAKAESVKAST